MREILFRGKHLFTNENRWSYGSLVDDSERVKRIYIPKLGNSVRVMPETVGQYTGLKDRNGNRIFEGDILSGQLDDLFPENETRLTVVWHETGWFGWNHGCHAFDDFENQFSRQFEIIGNIHDNPELVKGGTS